VLVTGILEPVPLAPELDYAALIGVPVATDHYGFGANTAMPGGLS
jgi:putative ABC transport system permease protein